MSKRKNNRNRDTRLNTHSTSQTVPERGATVRVDGPRKEISVQGISDAPSSLLPVAKPGVSTPSPERNLSTMHASVRPLDRHETTLHSHKEDIRSDRAMIISALVAAFTVPVGSLTVQKMEAFLVPIPRTSVPWAWVIIALWGIGAVLLFVFSLLPWGKLSGVERKMEKLVQDAREAEDKPNMKDEAEGWMQKAKNIAHKSKNRMDRAGLWALIALIIFFTTAVLEFYVLTIAQL